MLSLNLVHFSILNLLSLWKFKKVFGWKVAIEDKLIISEDRIVGIYLQAIGVMIAHIDAFLIEISHIPQQGHFVTPIHHEWRLPNNFTNIPAILFHPKAPNASLQSTFQAVI